MCLSLVLASHCWREETEGSCDVTSYNRSLASELVSVNCTISACDGGVGEGGECDRIERSLSCIHDIVTGPQSAEANYCTIDRNDFSNESRAFICKVHCSNETPQQANCLCYSEQKYLSHAATPEFRLNWLYYVSFVWMLIFLPIVIFFNINLASGPSHAFVFFYQCVPLVVKQTVASYSSIVVLQNVNSTLGNFLVSTEPCEVRHENITITFFARLHIVDYCKYIFVIFFIVSVLFLVWCSWCPLQKCRLPWAKTRRAVRNFREKHIGGTFIHGICSIIILSFGDLVAISMIIIYEGMFVLGSNITSCCFNVNKMLMEPCDGSGTHITNFYYTYVSFACIVLLLLLPLPLSLIYYPTIPALFHKLTKRSLPRFPKLDPVFDVFQGVYKDKMRWFAGLHLLYRMILWMTYLSLAKFPFARNSILIFCFLVILIIHSLFQPFKKPKHNYLETLYLLNLIVIALYREIFIDLFQDNCQKHGKLSDAIVTFFELLSYVPHVLYFVPLVVVVLWYCVHHRDRVTKPCCRRCSCNRFALCFKSWRRQEEVRMTEDVPSSEYTGYTEAEWSV